MRTAYLLEMAALLAIGAACAGGAVSPLQAQTPPGMPNPANPAASNSGQALNWVPAPDVFPAGAEMAVLQGDPSAAGEIFTVRMRMPDGYIIPAHWHPTDEHVTVL